jgi:ActR/RegA family two-component response regulator
MATILLVGTDAALLEGLAQTLGSAEHRTVIADGLPEAVEVASAAPPLLAVVEARLAASGVDVLRIPLQPGGSLVLYRGMEEPRVALAAPVQRATLADLALPLERHRLVALVQHIETRCQHTGRGRRDTPPPQPSIE